MNGLLNISWDDALKYDGTREGLTEREFSNYISEQFKGQYSQREIDTFFNIINIDNNKKIYEREFNAYLDNNAGAGHNSHEALSSLDWGQAKKYDGTREGLTYGEFENYIEDNHKDLMKDGAVEELFKILDADSSGKVFKSEMDAYGNQASNPSNKPTADKESEENQNPAKEPDNNKPSNDKGGITQGQATRFNVSRRQSSEWHQARLSGENVSLQYESLDRPYKGVISTDGADYILIVKSGGKDHNKIGNPESFFGTKDGDLVGFTGSKDKGIALVDVSGLDKINMNTGDSSVQIIRVKTDKELTVLNNGKGALDNEITRGAKGYDKDSVNKLGYSIDHRRVEAQDSSNSLFTLYADDESYRDDRVQKYGSASEFIYYGGDDSSYLMKPGAKAEGGSGSGNGAIIHIGVK